MKEIHTIWFKNCKARQKENGWNCKNCAWLVDCIAASKDFKNPSFKEQLKERPDAFFPVHGGVSRARETIS